MRSDGEETGGETNNRLVEAEEEEEERETNKELGAARADLELPLSFSLSSTSFTPSLSQLDDICTRPPS